MKKLLFFMLLCAGAMSANGQTLQLDSTQISITIAIDSDKVVSPWDLE